MSDKAEEEMEVDSAPPQAEEEENEKKMEDDDDGADAGDEEEDDDDEDRTPKKRTPKTQAEKRLSRLSAGMEMRGMMTESYKCKECDASYSRKSKLDYHIANAHPKKPDPAEEPSPRRGRKAKTPRKVEKRPKNPPGDTPEGKKKLSTTISAEVKRMLQKQSNSQPVVVLKQQKLPKVTTISNEKVKYNWGYYCTACDMYFANMFAQQFHCLHGQAKFRCEACCICFKLRKNFMSHVQMVHGVDIPEEVLARMRPRSEIRAKLEADGERSSPKPQEVKPIDLSKKTQSTESSVTKEAGLIVQDKTKSDRSHEVKVKESKSQMPEKTIDLTKDNETDSIEEIPSKAKTEETPSINSEKAAKTMDVKRNEAETKGDAAEGRDTKKDDKKEDPDVIILSDSPAKELIKGAPFKQKLMKDLKQSESGGNSSNDESDKKDEGRVYLTTVRMGNTYVTLPSGEKWMIECLRCHQAFFKMEDASIHMKQRPGSQFSCPHCHYNSTLFSQCDYEIHRLRTHSFPCAQCRQSFILECQRDMHEQKIHNYFRQLVKKRSSSAEGNSHKHAMSSHQSAHPLASNKTVVIQASAGHALPKTIVNKDGYAIAVKAQRTPYMCLMCDRDCYTRDALEHHKKTFHSAVFRPKNRVIHPISKNPAVISQRSQSIPKVVKSTNAPVSKLLQDMRQVSRSRTPAEIAAIAAYQNPFLEPNKVPQAYISRIKVELPEANKLVDDIRSELLKGPSNFAMPNYAKPTKFNKDMVTNPNVVKLSREVAYKLYFDLQGPCNDSDKMNYNDASKILYKIPMGCHSMKLKEFPLFPTLDDLKFRTQNYTIPPLSTIAPVELFEGFEGGLSMQDSIKFSAELDNVMFGSFTKVMRALTMIYSSRRVAVSEGFWRLQTKALIAILKSVEDQRKKEIAERAKAATIAAKAAAAAAAGARPMTIKLNQIQQMEASGSLSVVDMVQQMRPEAVVPNGTYTKQPGPSKVKVQGQGGQSTLTARQVIDNVVASISVNAVDMSSPRAVEGTSQSKQSKPDSDQSKAASSKTSTSPDIPSLQSLAKNETGKEEEEEKKKELPEERKEEEKKEEEKDGEEKDGEEDEKQKEAGEEGKEKKEEEKNKEKVLVNGSSSPPPGIGMNGTMQNGPSEGGAPANGMADSGGETVPSSKAEGTPKAQKPSGVEASPQPVNVPNGTVHASITGGTTTFVGSTMPIAGGARPFTGGTTPVVSGTQVLNLVSGSLRLPVGVPIQFGNVGSGNIGFNGLGGNVLQIRNSLGQVGGGGLTLGGGRVVSSGPTLGSPGVGSISRPGGNGILLTVPSSNAHFVSVPKLASSVGALSAVATIQNIPSPDVVKSHVGLSINKTVTANPGVHQPLIAKPSGRILPEKIAHFIRSNFINIKPKEGGGSYIPIKVEALPAMLTKKPGEGAAEQPHPMVNALIKLSQEKATLPDIDKQPDAPPEDPVLTRVLQSMTTLKQLQACNFLPEELCRKIDPLCKKILLASTPIEDKQSLSKEVDAILNAESQDALKLLDDATDINDNSDATDGDPPKDSAGNPVVGGIDKFLNNLTKRIKYIQNRLSTRSIDPVTMSEIVPLCQDICDPKILLKRKVECIKDIEHRFVQYEQEVTSQDEGAAPVDISAVPREISIDDDIDVHFKLSMNDGTSVMVDMNSIEEALEAAKDCKRLRLTLKRMSENDIKNAKRRVKRAKAKDDNEDGKECEDQKTREENEKDELSENDAKSTGGRKASGSPNTLKRKAKETGSNSSKKRK